MTQGRKWPRSLGLSLLVALCGNGCDPAIPPAGAKGSVRHFFRGTPAWNVAAAADFTLLDQYGRPFRLADQRGRVVLIFFGYVFCPDVCPTTLATWSRVRRLLADEGDRIRFVFITVDPERDTRERLAEHLRIFGPDFLGLTGAPADLEPVYRTYRVDRAKVEIFESAAGYLVDHTSSTFLVDPEGTLRLLYTFDAEPEDIAADVRWLLEHAAGPEAGRAGTTRGAGIESRPAG